MTSPKKTIVLGITASIAAYRACDLINGLKKKHYDVICILTGDAEHFITPLTIETLSGNKVYRDMFRLPEKREVAHIALGKKPDAIVICPATANAIAKLAAGMCDDLLSATVISSESPVIICPAMNDNMYRHKVTQRNIRALKEIGYKFVDPICGHLACGYVGVGHLADTADIIKTIIQITK